MSEHQSPNLSRVAMPHQPGAEPRFGSAAADAIAQLVGIAGDQLKLSGADRDWALRMLWTLGNTAPIAGVEQFWACRARVLQILAEAGAPLTDTQFAAFVRRAAGIEAIVLKVRMAEFEGE